jgi:hypothetical protein
MGRREDLAARLTSLQGPKDRALAIGRWVALNRDELIDGAPAAIVPALLEIERIYYSVEDGVAPVSELIAAFRAVRDAVQALA